MLRERTEAEPDKIIAAHVKAPESDDARISLTPVLVATRAERRRLIARGHPKSHAGEAVPTEQSLPEP